MSNVHAFFMHMYQFLFLSIDSKLFGAFLRVSLSLFVSLAALWHLNENLLRPETFFVSRHLLLLPPLILFLLTSDFVMIKPVRTFRRTSHDEAFIQNAKSFYQVFPILTFPLSSIVGVGSHCVASRSLVRS